MSGGAEPVKINPGEVEQTVQGVAGTLAQAAQPGPVPTATGTSPIDGAALAASGIVISLVAGASAGLGPRGGGGAGAAARRGAGRPGGPRRKRTAVSWGVGAATPGRGGRPPPPQRCPP